MLNFLKNVELHDFPQKALDLRDSLLCHHPSNGDINFHQVIAKTRIAPLKRATLL